MSIHLSAIELLKSTLPCSLELVYEELKNKDTRWNIFKHSLFSIPEISY